jgi:hypothetical protein
MAYMSQERKAKTAAAALKTIVPAGWKWSLAVHNHSTIILTIQSAPVDLIAEVNRVGSSGHRGWQASGHCHINECALDAYVDGELLETFKEISAALNDGNHDRSDIQTDYFDVGWYTEIQLGRWNRPFICTAPSAVFAA